MRFRFTCKMANGVSSRIMMIPEDKTFSYVLQKVARSIQTGYGNRTSTPLNAFLAFDGSRVDLSLDALTVYIQHGSHLGVINIEHSEQEFIQFRSFCLHTNSGISMNVVNELFQRLEIEPVGTVRQVLIFGGGGGNSPLDIYKAGGSSVEYVNHVMTNILDIPYECVYSVRGDGSCLYHATIYQILRLPGIRGSIHRRARGIKNPFELRQKSLDYLKDPHVRQMPIYQMVEDLIPDNVNTMDEYIQFMQNTHEPADYLAIAILGIFLNKEISLASNQNTKEHPFTNVLLGTGNPPPITLAYIPNVGGGHFEPIQRKGIVQAPEMQLRPSRKRHHFHDEQSQLPALPQGKDNEEEENASAVDPFLCKGCNKEVALLISHLKRTKHNCKSFYDLPSLEREQREARLKKKRDRDANSRSDRSSEKRNDDLRRQRESMRRSREGRSAERREGDLRRDRVSKSRST